MKRLNFLSKDDYYEVKFGSMLASYDRDKDFSIVAKEVAFELHEDGFTVTLMGSGISIYEVWAYEDSLK